MGNRHERDVSSISVQVLQDSSGNRRELIFVKWIRDERSHVRLV